MTLKVSTSFPIPLFIIPLHSLPQLGEVQTPHDGGLQVHRHVQHLVHRQHRPHHRGSHLGRPSDEEKGVDQDRGSPRTKTVGEAQELYSVRSAPHDGANKCKHLHGEQKRQDRHPDHPDDLQRPLLHRLHDGKSSKLVPAQQ